MTQNNNQNRRVLSLSAALDKSELASEEAVLMLIQFDIRHPQTLQFIETVRVINMPQDPATMTPDDTSGGANFKGHYYAPATFDIQLSEKSGEVPQVSLSMNDVGGALRVKLDQYQGGVNSDVTVRLVYSSTLERPVDEQSAEIEYTFVITDSGSNDREVSVTLGAPNLLMTSFPRRTQMRDFCPWEYKGPQCKYAGARTHCDRTLVGEHGCKAHENTLNFGGFPGIVPQASG